MSRETGAGEATVTLMCSVFAISRAAYYAALRPGAGEPAEVKRLPRRPDHASAQEVLAGIREVIAAEPAWGVRKVWAMLRRDPSEGGKGLRVSRRRVWALMHEHGLVLARDREPGEVARGHVSVPEPNRRLATDMTTTWTRQDGVVAIVPTMDCGCRSVLALKVTKDQTGPVVLGSVREALEAAFGSPAGVPEGVELRTDHGPQYTGADCAALTTAWHLEHTFAPVGRPTGNAVVERLIRTMKEEVVWLRDWDSAAELQEALTAWVVRYNTRRPHQSLDWMTPSEYRASKLNTGLAREAA